MEFGIVQHSSVLIQNLEFIRLTHHDMRLRQREDWKKQSYHNHRSCILVPASSASSHFIETWTFWEELVNMELVSCTNEWQRKHDGHQQISMVSARLQSCAKPLIHFSFSEVNKNKLHHVTMDIVSEWSSKQNFHFLKKKTQYDRVYSIQYHSVLCS